MSENVDMNVGSSLGDQRSSSEEKLLNITFRSKLRRMGMQSKHSKSDDMLHMLRSTSTNRTQRRCLIPVRGATALKQWSISDEDMCNITFRSKPRRKLENVSKSLEEIRDVGAIMETPRKDYTISCRAPFKQRSREPHSLNKSLSKGRRSKSVADVMRTLIEPPRMDSKTLSKSIETLCLKNEDGKTIEYKENRVSFKDPLVNIIFYKPPDDPVIEELVEHTDQIDLEDTLSEQDASFNVVDLTAEQDDTIIVVDSDSLPSDLIKFDSLNSTSEQIQSDIWEIPSSTEETGMSGNSPLKSEVIPYICVLKQETGSPFESLENKENMDDSNTLDKTIVQKPEVTSVKPRDSILKLFDPLYSGRSQEKIAPLSNQKILEELHCNSEEIVIKDIKSILDDGNEIEYSLFRDSLPQVIKQVHSKMESSLESSIKAEEELTTLKLDLNQLQQDKSSLELELHQKDEVILKTQGEAQKRENLLKQEIKTLNEKLAQTSEVESNEELKLLKSENQTLKKSEQDLLAQISDLCSNEGKFKALMTEYESTFSQKVNASQKLKEEHDTAKRHLATLEMSFSDLHTKYERSKDIIAGYKDNEETLLRNLESAQEGAIANEGRYNMLKAHAKTQLDKSNKEILLLKKEHHMEVSKLTTIIRRLEIRVESIQQALDQKTVECTALAALCDEVTGSIPQ